MTDREQIETAMESAYIVAFHVDDDPLNVRMAKVLDAALAQVGDDGEPLLTWRNEWESAVSVMVRIDGWDLERPAREAVFRRRGDSLSERENTG